MSTPEKLIAEVIALYAADDEPPGNAARKIIAALDEAGYEIIQRDAETAVETR